MEIRPIAHIRTDFKEKFGIPRQSGLVEELQARIVFDPGYRLPQALQGLEGFDFIWLIWGFSGNEGQWFPTVRPPRLGGNGRMGVWATRSPFRPNSLGLSSVRLVGIDTQAPDGAELIVSGADLMDGTPIYDIKPYITYADSHPEAACGYVDSLPERVVSVCWTDELKAMVPEEKFAALDAVLRCDPRPAYRKDGDREYGVSFAGLNVRFVVKDDVLNVIGIEKDGRQD